MNKYQFDYNFEKNNQLDFEKSENLEKANIFFDIPNIKILYYYDFGGMIVVKNFEILNCGHNGYNFFNILQVLATKIKQFDKKYSNLTESEFLALVDFYNILRKYMFENYETFLKTQDLKKVFLENEILAQYQKQKK